VLLVLSGAKPRPANYQYPRLCGNDGVPNSWIQGADFPAFGNEGAADKDTAEEHRLYLLTHADSRRPQWVATQ
jgi:hypothetical protein